MNFDKYLQHGAYHWRNMNLDNWRDFNPVVAARYEYTLKLVSSGAQKVLDDGCGDNYLLHRLALMGKEVWGVDTSHEGLLAGQMECSKYRDKYSTGDPKLVQATGLELPFKNGQFDMVILTEVLEHVDQPEMLLVNIKRVLAPSGSLILSTPNRQSVGYRDSHHVYEYTPDELQRLLSQYFSNVEIYGLGNAHFFRWYKRHLNKTIWKRFLRLMCSLGVNPFMYPFKMATASSHLLFGICR